MDLNVDVNKDMNIWDNVTPLGHTQGFLKHSSVQREARGNTGTPLPTSVYVLPTFAGEGRQVRPLELSPQHRVGHMTGGQM